LSRVDDKGTLNWESTGCLSPRGMGVTNAFPEAPVHRPAIPEEIRPDHLEQ
jgi:hypothetical protein